jgi:hypothetical protein
VQFHDILKVLGVKGSCNGHFDSTLQLFQRVKQNLESVVLSSCHRSNRRFQVEKPVIVSLKKGLQPELVISVKKSMDNVLEITNILRTMFDELSQSEVLHKVDSFVMRGVITILKPL